MTTQSLPMGSGTAAPPAPPKKVGEGGGLSRFNSLPPAWKYVFMALTLVALGLFVCWTFSITIFGWAMESFQYYYLLYVIFMIPIFIGNAARKKDKKRLPWYDIILGFLGTGIAVYFFLNTAKISMGAWQTPPDTLVFALGTAMLVLSIEAGRRVGGWVFTLICLVFGSYPLFASYMPGVFYGISLSFPKLVGQFAFSTNGILGMPAEVNGNLVIGYLFFSGIMVASGAGKFFLDFAMALLGRFRGGPAKVSVIASALFGSLSASAVANVVAIGSVTIPAMKKLGYPAHYAGAIEACASTGDSITPPVMGTIAFIMAVLTGVDYSLIAIAAIIPAVLFFFGLLVQVDGYAARSNMKGMPREEIPSMLKTLKSGWAFIVAIGFLGWALVVQRWTAQGPIWTSLILVSYSVIAGVVWWQKDKGHAAGFFASPFGRFLCGAFPNVHRMSRQKFLDIIGQSGGLVAWMIAILLPVGLIITGLTVTGTTASLISQIIRLGEANTFVILLVVFVVCYILGMMGLALIPYLFLAVTIAPALVKAGGLDVVGVHLFLVYNVILSGITPPVAMLAFVGAAVAGAPPMKTAWMSMRLGICLIFVPFFFVYNPSLLLRGDNLIQLVWLLPLVLTGIWVLTSGLEGYLIGLGPFPMWARPLFVIGGFLIAIPWGWQAWVPGGVISLLTAVAVLAYNRRRSRVAPA